MNETLVIGSTVADVIINVPKLPETGEDIIFSSQQVNLGGCAFNVSEILRHFKIPYTLCSPVGGGIYGAFVKQSLKKKNIKIFAESNEENGCCYCLVDEKGERSFMSRHGAEYKFDRKNFSDIDLSKIDSAYICGLELEESTAENEIEFIEEIFNFHKKNGTKFTLYFAPAPRIMFLNDSLMQRIFACNPVLHLNKEEALNYTRHKDVLSAAEKIYESTKNHVIITCGPDGAFFFDADTKELGMVPSIKTTVTDTIGAGDSHFGSVIASLKLGNSLKSAVITGNKVAAKLVSKKGSTLTDEEFSGLGLEISQN